MILLVDLFVFFNLTLLQNQITTFAGTFFSVSLCWSALENINNIWIFSFNTIGYALV